MGLFEKLKQGLKKTAQFFSTDIRDLFKSEGQLVNDKFVNQLLENIIKTDMGVEAAKESPTRSVSAPRPRREDGRDPGAHRKKLKVMLAQPAEPIRFASSGPTVIMVAGVNGAGKTTSIAKLTAMFQGEGKTVVLGTADTFRAAAVEQLTIWARRLGRRSSRAHRAATRPAHGACVRLPVPWRSATMSAWSTRPAACRPSRA